MPHLLLQKREINVKKLIKYAVLLIIFTAVLYFGYTLYENITRKTHYNLLCIGDSVTESEYGSYTGYLETFFKKAEFRVRVYSRAKPGNTSGEYLKYLEESNLIKEINPDITVIMLGTNDVRTDSDNTSVENFKKNMSKIIKTVKRHKNPDGSKTNIFIATVPPIFKIDLRVFNQYSKARIKEEINPAIKELAKQEGIILLNINGLFLKNPHLLPGIHPNKEGYLQIAKFIFKKVLSYIKGSPPEKEKRLPSIFEGKIAFQSDRSGNEDIFIINRDGIRQLTHSKAFDGYPSISPDAKMLVFESDRSGRFELYITDMIDRTKKLFDSPSQDRSPFWTYDGQFLYFSRLVKGKEQVFRYAFSNKKVEQITNYRGRNGLPTVSPSGSILIITSNRFIGWNLYKTDLNTGKEEKFAGGYGGCRAKFAHKEQVITFVSHKFDKKGDVFLTPVDKFNPVRLTIDSEKHDYFPAFSPDDRYIVFASSPSLKPGKYNLKIIELATKKIWIITSSLYNDRMPYWAKN